MPIRRTTTICTAFLRLCALFALALIFTTTYTPRAKAQDITSNLMMHWTFDEGSGTTVSDETGNFDASILSNGTYNWEAGHVGTGALKLNNGSGNSIVRTDAPLNFTPGDYTISFWIKPYSYNNYNQAMGDDWGTIWLHTTGANQFYVGHEVAKRISASSGFYDSFEWQLVTFTYDVDTGAAKLYKNGSLVTSGSFSVGGEWPEFRIAKSDASFDDLRIYNRTLTEADITALYEYRTGNEPDPPSLSDDLFLHWDFEDATGNTVTDKSNNNRDGTIQSTGIATWIPGKIGNNALDFGPTTNTTNLLVDNLAWTPTAYTVAFWAKPDYFANYNMGVGSGWNQFYTHTSSSQSIYIGTSGGSRLTPGNFYTNGAWQHVTFTYNAGLAVLYKNGTYVTHTTGMAAPAEWDDFYLNGFSGGIDDLRIYERALSSEEVQNLYDYIGPTALPCNAAYEAVMIYNQDEGQLQYCNGTYWTAIGSSSTLTSSADCTGEGDAFYNDTDSGHCYYRVASTTTTWNDAKTACEANDSYLFAPSTETENNTVYAALLPTGTHQIYHLGATDSNVEGEWRWVNNDTQFWQGLANGSAVDDAYANWETNEPNDIGSQDCLGYNWNKKKWIDQYCHNTSGGVSGYICERDTPSPVPCTAPAGVEGEINYNYTQGVMQYCGKTGWINVGPILKDASLADDLNLLETPTEGLVAHLKLDDGSGLTATDSSGKGNNGTLIGMDDSNWVTGRIGGAVDFDTSSDKINITTPNNMPTKEITVSAWVRVAAHANWHNFVRNNWSSSSPTATWLLYSDANGRAAFGLWGANTSGQKNGFGCVADFTTEEWHLITGTYDGTTVKVYLNGEQCETTSTISDLTLKTDGTIQISNYGDNDVDDVRIYNRALSAAEVQRLYTNTGSLVGHWKLDETEGTTATDSSGNGNNGTLTNMDGDTDWVAGANGNALDFDGSNDYVNVNDNTDIEPSNITISAWVNLNDTTSDHQLIRKQANNGKGYDIRWQDGAGIRFWVNAGSTPTWDNVEINRSEISAGTWQHLIGTYDGTTIKLFVDGELVNSKSHSSGGNLNYDTANLHIGSARPEDNNYNFNGQIDDVRIYDYALTDEQVAALYTGTGGTRTSDSGPPTDGLIGYWDFEDGAGITLTDQAGDNDGTLTNMDAGTDWVAGKIGDYALDLDGDNDHIILPIDTASSNTLTFTAWVKLDSKNAYDGILYSRSSTWGGINISPDGSLAFTWTGAGGGSSHSWNGGPTIPTGNWALLAVTIEPTKATVYVGQEGGSLSSAVSTVNLNATAYDDWKIGTDDQGGRYLDGQIDEVRIYNRTLTADEITAIFEYDGTAGSSELLTCSSPDGVEGEIVYNDDEDLMQYCGPGGWVAMR